MECGIATNYNSEVNKSTGKDVSQTSCNNENKTAKSGLRVNFTEKGEVKERREKFLTAKYGTHQMSLIRKRLAVEMWLFEEIQKLCSSADVTKEVDVDIDELLDLENDDQRRQQIKVLLTDIVEVLPQNVKTFTDDLLEKIKTL